MRKGLRSTEPPPPTSSGEVLALRVHCVHTAHAEAEMGRVRFPKLQSNLCCDLLTVQWPK